MINNTKTLTETIDALNLPWISVPTPEIVQTEPGVRRVRMGRSKRELTFSSETHQPMSVSYGMGTDSTAMLILMVAQGIRPDVIMFADTGDEKADTYAYIEKMNAFLIAHDFPEITVMKNKSKLYGSLSENCLVNKTLPSLAYGRKGCSLKWKVAPMETWANNNAEDFARAWDSGLKVRKCIGYDASPADCKRSDLKEDDKYIYSYPLRDAGLTRPDLYRIIAAAGMPQPGKSACFMCPASKRAEIEELAENQPELCACALKIEANAEARTQSEREVYSTVGLGRKFSWRDYLSQERPELLEKLDAWHDTDHVLAGQVKAERVRRGIGVKKAKKAKLAA